MENTRTSVQMNLDDLLPQHFPSVREIYEQGIATGNATFKTEAPTWEEWDKGHLPHCRFAALRDGETIGWAALTPVSDTCIFSGVAEVSVYVREDHRGQGVGKALLEKLIAESEKRDIWTLQAGIFPENKASIKVHEQLGFRKIGYRERIGKLNGVWRDTLLLERRSLKTGL